MKNNQDLFGLLFFWGLMGGLAVALYGGQVIESVRALAPGAPSNYKQYCPSKAESWFDDSRGYHEMRGDEIRYPHSCEFFEVRTMS